METKSTQPAEPNLQQPKKPNETGVLSVTGYIKIFDPKTKEVFVEKRA